MNSVFLPVPVPRALVARARRSARARLRRAAARARGRAAPARPNRPCAGDILHVPSGTRVPMSPGARTRLHPGALVHGHRIRHSLRSTRPIPYDSVTHIKVISYPWFYVRLGARSCLSMTSEILQHHFIHVQRSVATTCYLSCSFSDLECAVHDVRDARRSLRDGAIRRNHAEGGIDRVLVLALGRLYFWVQNAQAQTPLLDGPLIAVLGDGRQRLDCALGCCTAMLLLTFSWSCSLVSAGVAHRATACGSHVPSSGLWYGVGGTNSLSVSSITSYAVSPRWYSTCRVIVTAVAEAELLLPGLSAVADDGGFQPCIRSSPIDLDRAGMRSRFAALAYTCVPAYTGAPLYCLEGVSTAHASFAALVSSVGIHRTPAEIFAWRAGLASESSAASSSSWATSCSRCPASAPGEIGLRAGLTLFAALAGEVCSSRTVVHDGRVNGDRIELHELERGDTTAVQTDVTRNGGGRPLPIICKAQ